MSEYGNGVSMAQAFKYDKERIKKAFDNLLLAGEDENGFVYKGCTKEEAQKYILSAFDNAVYWVFQMNAVGKTYEKMLNKYHEQGYVPDTEEQFKDYCALRQEQDNKKNINLRRQNNGCKYF